MDSLFFFKVVPGPAQFKEIIFCGGGVYLDMPPSGPADGTYVLSCPEDKTVLARLRRTGVKVMDKEFILSGVLKYKLDNNLIL